MKTALNIFQMLVSISVIGLILLQARGTGLGSTWGGGGESYRSKRGVEKILLVLTIILTIIFLLTAITSIAL